MIIRRTAVVVVMLSLAAACGSPSGPPEVTVESGTFAGAVWFDDDGDGQWDSDELSAEDVVVSLGAGDRRLDADSAQTDDRGVFAIDAPPSLEVINQLFLEVSFTVPGPVGSSIDVHSRHDVSIDDNSPLLLSLPTVAACEDGLDAALEDSSTCGSVLYPDLVPLTVEFGQGASSPVAEASVSIDQATQPGRVLLRLGSATANLGPGALHMIPGDRADDDRLGTFQRLWTDGHKYVDVPTGEFVFHEGHDHFHLDGFEQYRLLSLDRDVVAEGEKISFCLIDSLPAEAGQLRRGFGVFPNGICENANEQQVLNSGWADYYGPSLDDQWIDITGVEPGEYLVEIIVDPDNILMESDESNNRATFPLVLDAEKLDAT